MKTFDLPRDKSAFLCYDDWEFLLAHKGREFEASMDEIAGLREDEELSAFKKVIARTIDKMDEALDTAADHLLDIYNEKWSEEAPLVRERFIERLTISSVVICRDGSVELDFHDDDMFWGHAVVVHFDKEGAITDATIEG